LSVLLASVGAAGIALVLAVLIRASGGVGVSLAVAAFVTTLAIGAVLVLLGTDDYLSGRDAVLAREVPEARAAWLLHRKQKQVEREARRAWAVAQAEEERAERRREQRQRAQRRPEHRSRPAGEWLNGNGSFSLDVIGESHYQRALEHVCGGRTEASQDRVVTAVLILEDDNPYDSQAVCVTIDEWTVGYLPRQKARVFRARLRREGIRGDEFECRANIRGGWDRGDGDRGFFGVWLDVCLYARR
jgi:hypothetical protein